MPYDATQPTRRILTLTGYREVPVSDGKADAGTELRRAINAGLSEPLVYEPDYDVFGRPMKPGLPDKPPVTRTPGYFGGYRNAEDERDFEAFEAMCRARGE